MRHARYSVLCGVLLFFAACVPQVKLPVTAERALVKIPSRQFPNFSDDMSSGSLATAVDHSLDYLKRLDPSTPFRFGADTFTASQLGESIKAFNKLIQQRLPADKLRKAIQKSFWVYKSIGRDGHGEVLFTGYYEPVLKGSMRPLPGYPYPVYRRPDDLVNIRLDLFDPKYAGERLIGRCFDQTVIPYFSREDIDSRKVLGQKACELVWVSDQIDLFFMHVQGSGRVLLEDGTALHVNYDCSNGLPYRSIGRLLIDEGTIAREEMSMDQIRAYLKDHSDEMERIFNHNTSYIFFRLVDQGPVGAIDVPLTPGRSVATDLGLFPKAAPAFIQSEKPLVDKKGTILSWETFGRFVLNHDAGRAIRGPGRVDIFWGSGPYAEVAASHMQHTGILYFIVLKQAKSFDS